MTKRIRANKEQLAENESRKEAAIKRGDLYFESCVPCNSGHIVRYVNDSKCVSCKRAKQLRYMQTRSNDRVVEMREYANTWIKEKYHNDETFRKSVLLSCRIRKLHTKAKEALEELKGLNND